MDISRLIRKEVRELKAYQVEEPDLPVKLHANESPFNLSENIRTTIAEAVGAMDYNRYPDPASCELRLKLSEKLDVNADEILLGNGSDELIQMIIMAFGGHGAPVVFPWPTFSMYRNIAMSLGEEVTAVPLEERFSLNPDALIDIIKDKPSITFISYPNNPTSNCFDEDAIDKVIRASSGIVVIDEAYFDYSKKSFLGKLNDYENMIVLRTFSKIGMASLRIGALIASPRIVEAVNRVRLPYNIGEMQQRAALTALKCWDDIGKGIEIVIAERRRVFDMLCQSVGVEVFRADANFILFRVDNADDMFNKLKSKGVLVRNLNSEGPLRNCLRVTVGTREENSRFIDALKGM